MITTIIGVIKFKEDHVLINSILGVLKTEDGPLDLTLNQCISRVSLIKGTLPIKYNSEIENKLDKMGILEEVETFNKQFPTVVQGYRNELFKFDSLPLSKNRLDWLSEIRNLKINLSNHIHKCYGDCLKVSIELTCLFEPEIKGSIIRGQIIGGQIVAVEEDTDFIYVKTLSKPSLKISLDNIISLTYGG